MATTKTKIKKKNKMENKQKSSDEVHSKPLQQHNVMRCPERFRITKGAMASNSSYGNNGAFEIPLSNRTTAYVIASDGEGWEHVSVHVISNQIERTPTWSEMCKIKNLFWCENATVIQYHPPKAEYVNNHKHCLHLWRKIGFDFPLPNSEMVGFKGIA